MEIPCVSKQISRRSQIDRMMLQVQGYETMPSPPTDLVFSQIASHIITLFEILGSVPPFLLSVEC